jgi:hypothetical protein
MHIPVCLHIRTYTYIMCARINRSLIWHFVLQIIIRRNKIFLMHYEHTYVVSFPVTGLLHLSSSILQFIILRGPLLLFSSSTLPVAGRARSLFTERCSVGWRGMKHELRAEWIQTEVSYPSIFIQEQRKPWKDSISSGQNSNWIPSRYEFFLLCERLQQHDHEWRWCKDLDVDIRGLSYEAVM